MFQRIADRNIWLINGAVLMLGTAYGMAISIISIFLSERGYEKTDIGTLAVWFALGIVAFSLPMDRLIRRFTAKVTLAASLLGYATTVTLFPHIESFAWIATVRFFDGAFSVGVWVSFETILLHRAHPKHKAFVTTLYGIAMSLGYVLGSPLSAAVKEAYSKTTVFMVAGAIALGAAVLVISRLDRDDVGIVAHEDVEPESSPRPALDSGNSEPASGDWKNLLWRIKVSCLSTFSYGYFQAALVLFLPLYLIEEKGITETQTIWVPGIFALGMVLFSNFAGRLGDRHGHLLVMRLLGVVGTLTVLGFIFLNSYAVIAVAVFIGGATLASISPVSLALQGVVAKPREYSQANSIYNAFYAVGMLLGPLAAAHIAVNFSNGAMMFHLVALWAVYVVFTMVFASDDPARAKHIAARAARAAA